MHWLPCEHWSSEWHGDRFGLLRRQMPASEPKEETDQQVALLRDDRFSNPLTIRERLMRTTQPNLLCCSVRGWWSASVPFPSPPPRIPPLPPLIPPPPPFLLPAAFSYLFSTTLSSSCRLLLSLLHLPFFFLPPSLIPSPPPFLLPAAFSYSCSTTLYSSCCSFSFSYSARIYVAAHALKETYSTWLRIQPWWADVTMTTVLVAMAISVISLALKGNTRSKN